MTECSECNKAHRMRRRGSIPTACRSSTAAANCVVDGSTSVCACTQIDYRRGWRCGADLKFADFSLCYLTPKAGPKELKAYRVDPAAENTVMVYKNYTIAATFVNLPATDDGRVAEVIEKLLK